MKKRWDAAVWLLAPFFMLWLLEGLARGSSDSFFSWIAAEPLLATINYMFLLGLCLLAAVCRSRRVRACWLLGLGLVCALFGITNHYKLVYRLEPVLWSDITQLGDAAATLTGLNFDIDMRQIVLICAGFIVAMALCIILFKGRRAKRSIVTAAVGLVLCVGMSFLCTFELADGNVRTDMADHARNEGCLYTAFAAENHRRAQMTIAYDQAMAEEAYARMQAEAPALDDGAEKPNIIFVLSESFTDEAILSQGVQFTDTLMPFYQQLTKSCATGLLYVPKIGGGTSETEFEVLTGMQSKYAINPYSMGLPPTGSVASVLKDKGYTSTAVHWYTGVYYNRYHNLPMLGFDAIYTTDTTTRNFEKTGMFVSDEEHYRAIMEVMNATDSRDFIFCLTMQNHGGYGYDDFRQAYGADVPFSNALSPESEKILANYCYLLRRSDEALKAWIAQLEAFEEPTMVVFFGDHLAPLGTAVYEELGIPLSGDGAHLTPYFIWSNRQALTGETDLHAYQLGAYALSMAGLCDDPFLAHVEKLRQEGGSQDEDYDLVSYDVLFGEQYAYRAAGISPDNENCQIGGQMILNGFDTAVIDGAVYLKARLKDPEQNYKLYVNGRRQDVNRILFTDKPLTLQCVIGNYYGVRYNESAALTYGGTDDLLANSGTLRYTTLPLWESGYELVRDKWYQSYRVYRSLESIAAGDTAATLDGKRMDWQPTYGIGKANQYGVDSEGRVYLSILKSALTDQTGEGVRRYLQAQNGLIYQFEDQSKPSGASGSK